MLLATGHLRCAAVNVGSETQVVKDLKRLGAIRAREAREGSPPWISSKPSAKHVMKQSSIPYEQEILKDDA